MGIESEKIIQQAEAVAQKAWQEHPTINWQEEVSLYAQSEILLTQLINSDLPGAPAKGINFSKQWYGSGKAGVWLRFNQEGISKQLADMGIVSIFYQNQPQLVCPKTGEIRWLKIDWNNAQGDSMQDVYEFSGLSVTKRVTKFENGMFQTEVQNQKLSQEDFSLVANILGNMSAVVEKLNAGH